MVAKINTGSSLYGALQYNHCKVSEGTARIISANRMPMDEDGRLVPSIQKAMFAFEPYLAANRNTRKPILHISLNPSPEDRLTDTQFAALADDYMQKLGYGDQPYTVFMHEDTGRRHIHIVSTCVDERGRKIDDSYVYNRSMQACRELEEKYGMKKIEDKQTEMVQAYLGKVDHRKGDLKRQISNTLKSVFTSYRFQTFGEFSALLATFNIEAKQVRGEHDGKPYVGVVYSATDDKGRTVGPPFKSSLFDNRFGDKGISKRIKHNAKEFREGKWSPAIRNEVALAMHGCKGKKKVLVNLLKSRGIDIVLRENEQGRIYGVTFIDHNSREVYNGSRLGKEFSANAFETLLNGTRHQAPPPIRIAAGRQQITQGLENTIEAAFGIFDLSGFDPGHPDEYIPMPRRKKNKRKRTHTL